jgi:hypothetical protein
MGAVPVLKGEPAIGVSAPDAGLREKAETVLSPWFVTYTKLPDKSTATKTGPLPTANGEPGMGDKTPVV